MSERVVSEPFTYREDTPHSYFRDRVLVHHADTTHSDSRAAADGRARLKRHADEMNAEIPKREQEYRRQAVRAGVEFRANPDRVQGQGGYFAPPLWLIDHFATAPRPGRALARLAPNLPLPKGVQSVSVPRILTSTLTGTVQDLGTPADQNLTDTSVASPVATVAGQTEISVQLLEQSPPGAHVDWAIFKDLREDYDYQLEQQLIAGTGANGQLLGILNVSGINTVTDTTASPNGPQVFPYLGKAVAVIGDARGMPPEAWMLRTARWAWLATSEDVSNRPLLLQNVPGSIFPIGELVTIPAYPNDAIPTNLGGGSNQDVFIACRPSDMLVLESDPTTRVIMDTGVSGNLEARLQFYRYAAALVGRYPSGISVVQGTGMVIAAGF